jgi:transposase
MTLFPQSLESLVAMSREVGFSIRRSILNLDSGFDSKANRLQIVKFGMIPNIKENNRGRIYRKRGRPRNFNKATYKTRFKIEQFFSWEDKFRKLVNRYETIHCRHHGMRLIAYTLINIRNLVGLN